MPATNAPRKIVSHEMTVNATPEKVFPLLCPVREYDWIDGWNCTMVYSDSGVAEKVAIFMTDLHDGHAVWTVSRYEPDKAIEFVVVFPSTHVMTLEIALETVERSRTRLLWKRTFTSLDDSGTFVKALDRTGLDQVQLILSRSLEHYCATGKMLKVY